MRKLLIILLCCFPFSLTLSAQHGHTEITPVYNGFRDVITYDEQNNKISDIEQEFTNNAWHNIGINKAAYDTHNNVISSVSQYGWQCFFSYDTHNNLTCWIRQYKHDSAYANYEQYFYTYDTGKTKKSEILQTWNGKEWVNKSKKMFSHDSNLEQVWSGKEWVNSSHTLYTYNIKGNKTCVLLQYWMDSVWVNRERWLTTYDANNKEASYTDQIWEDKCWVPWQAMKDGVPNR